MVSDIPITNQEVTYTTAVAPSDNKKKKKS